MKINPQAKRHATEIINLIEELLEKNYQDYEGSDLFYDDYKKIREKLEKKFTKLLNKNKKVSSKKKITKLSNNRDWEKDDRKSFYLPVERDWFNDDPENY